jgi:hypothetical protein
LTTNARGFAVFSIETSAVSVGDIITATATGPDGSTSEFSRCAEVASGLVLVPGPIAFGGVSEFTFDVLVPIYNASDKAGESLVATLESLDQGLTVIQDQVGYGTVPAQTQVSPPSAFRVMINDPILLLDSLALLHLDYTVDGVPYTDQVPVVLNQSGATAAPEPDAERSADLRLRAYPNPANPYTTIAFDLPMTASARLRVYDAGGGLVRDLVDAELPAGSHSYRWDGRDRDGGVVSSGVYYFRLTAGERQQTGKVVILK